MEVYEALRALPNHKVARRDETPIEMFQNILVGNWSSDDKNFN